MSDSPRANFTQEEINAFSDEGREIAMQIAPVFHGMSCFVAYNVVGTLASLVFSEVEFHQPQDALKEFDNWAKFTRQHLADIIKERMQ